MKRIDGKTVAQEIWKAVQEKVSSFERKPCLCFLLVGDHPASRTYVAAKKKACLEVGIVSKVLHFPLHISQRELLREIHLLNQDPTIDAILVQLPLPAHIRDHEIMQAISPQKDVDGFHPLNVGKMLIGEPDGLLPCTPNGIKTLLKAYEIPVSGKHVVIVGRSNIVGKPLAAILMQKKEDCNASVTVVHSQSENLGEIMRSADILVAATGKPRWIKKEMIAPGAVVVDVGVNRLEDGTLVGDVDFESVFPFVSAITPVPGGVGPMTIAMLLSNTLVCYMLGQSASQS